MKTFQNVINEILDTASVLNNTTSNSGKTPNVNSTNDDFYARGDARLPTIIKKRKKKKELNKEDTSNLLSNRDRRILSMNPELKFQYTDSIDLSKGKKLFDIKNELVNGVIEKTRTWVRIQNRIKLKRNPFDIDFKKVKNDIEPHVGSSKVLYVGTYIENKRIKFIWYVK